MNSEEQKISKEQISNDTKHDSEIIQDNDLNDHLQENITESNCKDTEQTLSDQNNLRLRIDQLEIELTQKQFELRDSKLRAQAEIENLRRRCELDLEKAHKFSLEKFVNDLLPVIDNLERAIETVNVNDNINNFQISAIVEGINLTLKSLLNTVKKFGIEVINEINVPFNPDFHQAMTLIDSESITPNNIIMIMQKGYKLNGRLLRPAMVTVSKPKN